MYVCSLLLIPNLMISSLFLKPDIINLLKADNWTCHTSIQQWQASEKDIPSSYSHEMTFIFKWPSTVIISGIILVSWTFSLAVDSGSHALAVSEMFCNEINITINSTTIQDVSEKQPLGWYRQTKSKLDKKKKTRHIVKSHHVWLLSAESH